MKKILIPNYVISDDNNENVVIKDNINFCISPYFEELDEPSQKIFNSLLSKEKVYTERMMENAVNMLQQVRKIISDRLVVKTEELEKYKRESQNGLLCSHLIENYKRQLLLLSDLDNGIYCIKTIIK